MLKIGDEVLWTYTQRGGWGYTWNVPARIMGFTGKRVKIEAQLTRGGTKRVTVATDKLTSRADHFRRAFNDLICYG